MLIFGLGYSAGRLAARLRADGWQVDASGSAGNLRFDDDAGVRSALAGATHILSSVPPATDGSDPVLARYGSDLAAIMRANGIISSPWLGYLSSTGVYGDCAGAWVDESAALQSSRRNARISADLAWQQQGARVFRLPGIYGPGRSALDRLRAGKAHRIDILQQIFSRVHVDDIVSGVIAAFDPAVAAGVYNLADDLPASQNAVVEEAARLLGLPVPPLQSLENAGLSAMARSFYAENRRIANGKAKRLLGWQPRYPSFVEGLRELIATTIPASTSTPPAAASKVQR